MISNQYTNEATDIIINTVALIDSIKLDLNFLSMSVLTGNEKIKDDKFLFREEQAENLNKRIIELFDALKISIGINKTELAFETHDLYYKLLKQLTQIYELAIQLFNQLSIPASILINGVIKKKDLFFGYKNLKSLMVNCENVYKLLAKQIDISINVKLIKGGVKEEIPLIGPNEDLKELVSKNYLGLSFQQVVDSHNYFNGFLFEELDFSDYLDCFDLDKPIEKHPVFKPQNQIKFITFIDSLKTVNDNKIVNKVIAKDRFGINSYYQTKQKGLAISIENNVFKSKIKAILNKNAIKIN